MESSISLKRLVMKIKSNGAFVISLVLLGLSILYFLLTFYSFSADFSGAFFARIALINILAFIRNDIFRFPAVMLVVWITVGIIITVMGQRNWWIALICNLLTGIILLLGSMFGAFGPRVKIVDSVAFQTYSYHFNYISFGLDDYGYYGLVRCDLHELNCQQLYVSNSDYPNPDAYNIVHIKADTNTKRLTIIDRNKILYSDNLD